MWQIKQKMLFIYDMLYSSHLHSALANAYLDRNTNAFVNQAEVFKFRLATLHLIASN